MSFDAVDQIEPVARPPKLAARRVGYTAGSFANMRVRGTGPKYVQVNRKILYRDIDVDEWLAAHLRTSTSEVVPA